MLNKKAAPKIMQNPTNVVANIGIDTRLFAASKLGSIKENIQADNITPEPKPRDMS